MVNTERGALSVYVVSFVVNTSVTLSRNAACDNGASVRYNFDDTIWVEGASNAAGTLTVAQGSTFELKGSINGGTY